MVLSNKLRNMIFHYRLFLLLVLLPFFFHFYLMKIVHYGFYSKLMTNASNNAKPKILEKGCILPDIAHNSSQIMMFMENVPPVNCDHAEPDWVTCSGSVCSITEAAVKKYSYIECVFQDLLWIDDFGAFKLSHPVDVKNGSYKLIASDFARAMCKALDGSVWTHYVIGARYVPNSGWALLPQDSPGVNVLMLILESTSRNQFIRKLPKSYEYLTETLGTIVLRGYNIVGDGTPAAFIPFLTGYTEAELPDTRRRFGNKRTVDVYPFVWNDYRGHGYVTGYFEDLVAAGVFTYRLNGFSKQPTHHYSSVYYKRASEVWDTEKFCYGSIPRHQIMLDFVKNFWSVQKDAPKFMIAFHGELSHSSYNNIAVIDDDLLKFLKHLRDDGSLEDTVLIVMADHGQRYGAIRETVQGKQEERLPFMSIRLPEKLKKRYPTFHRNLLKNSEVLCTPFDLYPTLLEFLSPEISKRIMKNLRIPKSRSISLITSLLPANRTCGQAFVEPHWCTCLNWHKFPVYDFISYNLAIFLARTINNYTEYRRRDCDELTVKRIIAVTKVEPYEYLLKFKQSVDPEALIPDFSGKTMITDELYQIKAQFRPGDAIFEASINYNIPDDSFTLSKKDISRINQYGQQARCIQDRYPHLRKYCHCKHD